jgi:hypothetical protein
MEQRETALLCVFRDRGVDFFTPPFVGLAPFVVENLMTVYLRFADLKALGIVRNHTTLKRWIEKRGFPVGIWIGANTHVWPKTKLTLGWPPSLKGLGTTAMQADRIIAAMRSGAILHKQIIEGPAVYCLGRDQWSRARTCSGDGGEISQATAAYCANASWGSHYAAWPIFELWAIMTSGRIPRRSLCANRVSVR